MRRATGRPTRRATPGNEDGQHEHSSSAEANTSTRYSRRRLSPSTVISVGIDPGPAPTSATSSESCRDALTRLAEVSRAASSYVRILLRP